MERIASEKRFAGLSKILARNLQKADAEFVARFDRIKLQRLVFESERLKTEEASRSKSTEQLGRTKSELNDEVEGFSLEKYIS